MKYLLLIALLVTGLNSYASPKEVYITLGSDANLASQKGFMAQEIAADHEVSVMKITEDVIPALSEMMHDNFKRCGGFIVHESKEEALATAAALAQKNAMSLIPFANYSITEGETVRNYVSQVSEINIRTVIEKLSSFHNRYYKAQTGVDSQKFVLDTWKQLGKNRTDVKVEYFKHRGWPQPSVIMTVKGTSKSDEIIVIGGHADSISGYFGGSRAKAPGADDNASGIATITEVIRVIMDNGYRPEKTIKFMAYAAEEVGLRGSKEIADKYRKEGKNVIGVVQLDMTNHKGTSDKDIVFMTDYTNKDQTAFMGRLIDEYVHVPWGFSKCGYGCSDHASWHNKGYPASMPFESTMQDINGHIHTKNDTISQSGGDASHAEKFAKLAVAFLVEMGK
jgi:leucyl aminopeptidase